jgi:hypothetical protein
MATISSAKTKPIKGFCGGLALQTKVGRFALFEDGWCERNTGERRSGNICQGDLKPTVMARSMWRVRNLRLVFAAARPHFVL